MSDKELLELAAKAAGIKINSVIGDTFWRPEGITWNPIADDADALRLAVALGLHISTGPGLSHVRGGDYVANELCGNDPFAATRRAIVRAAAEIGKAMP